MGERAWWRIAAVVAMGLAWSAGDVEAQMIPRHCGMTDRTVSYGSVGIGTQIVLGRHTPWAGDANWASEMERWVGSVTTVTSLDGVDSAGCPVVHVAADGGQYYWRLRDAQPAAPAPALDPIPRHCGMTDATAQFGVVRPGTALILGRHTAWAGDTNWTSEMEAFVGQVGVVTTLEGADEAGCPVVRVSIDGGRYYWRVRDARLAGGGMPMPTPIPTFCGMGAAQYGPVVVGSLVILGMHTPWNGDTNWAPDMGRYVGQRATVTQLAGLDSVGCPVVRVSADGGQFAWRIRDMRL